MVADRTEEADDDLHEEQAEVPEPLPARGPGVPRWRQIEIMQERAKLRRELDDFDLDFEALDAEVFGSEADHDVFYRHLEDIEDEDIDEDIGDLEDDADDDFADDETDEDDDFDEDID